MEAAIARAEKRYQVNAARLMRRLEALARIGANAQGGIDRQLGSDADFQARRWLAACWQEALGLMVRADAIANLWGTVPGAEAAGKPIFLGSHHDTVPNGGRFDGALGVLMATEVLQTLRENDVPLRHPIGVVSFTGEEPNSFSVSTLGTKVLSGRLGREELDRLKDCNNGERLETAIERLGGNMAQVDKARLMKGLLAAFMECHIEQGRRLYDRG